MHPLAGCYKCVGSGWAAVLVPMRAWKDHQRQNAHRDEGEIHQKPEVTEDLRGPAGCHEVEELKVNCHNQETRFFCIHIPTLVTETKLLKGNPAVSALHVR